MGVSRSLDRWIAGSMDWWMDGSVERKMGGSLDRWIDGSLRWESNRLSTSIELTVMMDRNDLSLDRKDQTADF